MTVPADIAIVGGGMVGASLALALAQLNPRWRIEVLEAVAIPDGGAEPRYQPSYDARSTALSYGSQRIYSQLGIWRQLHTHVAPIRHIHVSDRGRFGATRLDAKEYRVDALGYVVENQWLGRVLWSAMQGYSAIRLRCPVAVTGMLERASSEGPLMELALESSLEDVPERLQARLVVLADGGRSGLREQLRIRREVREYDQAALIANVSTEKPHLDVAFERFTEQGPMALLPLVDDPGPSHRSALVWTLPAASVEEIRQRSDSEFLEHLQERFGYRLGRFTQVGSRHLYPLVLERAVEQVRPGLVLLGNAAHVLHPVAGQGYNLALREAVSLAETLNQAQSRGQALGDLAVLNEFLASQAADQERTLRFSDALIQVFANDNRWMGLARDFGLLALDMAPPLKEMFSRYAMGLGGREALLAKGSEPRLKGECL